MKYKIYKMVNSNIKVRVSGKNINNFIKRLIKNNISIIRVIPKNYKEVDLIISYNTLEDIKKIKTIYNIEIIRYYGIINIIRKLKKNTFIIFFLIIFGIIIYILSNMIFSIEIIHSNSNIVKLINEELKQNGIKKYSFVKNYNELENIEKKILENNKDTLEWMEIIRNGTKYTVRIENRIIDKKENTKNKYNIIASKNAVIKSIEAQSGEKVKEVDTYVKKGDIIISAYITMPNGSTILSEANGSVEGEVWYLIDINYPYYYNEVNYTGRKKRVLTFNFMKHKYSLFDFNKYKSFDRNSKYIFKNNIIPISLSLDYEYETNIINEIYNHDEALEKAKILAQDKLKDKYKKIIKISDIKIISEVEEEKNLNLTFFITAIENITEYQKVIEEN